MEWTRALKYRTLEDVPTEEMERLTEKVKHAKWRQSFHIQPISGLLNDPNGLVYHEGLYHIFYQWHPFGAVHGMKYWYHVTSPDLVNFTQIGPAVKPDTVYDSHGAYSGSAVIVDNEVKLVYTGNHRTQSWTRVPYQVVSTLKGQEAVDKQAMIEGPPTGYTEHFRDPKVWYDDKRKSYYIVIGAQRENMTGAIVVYASQDFNNWHQKGELKTKYPSFGYMWECPDYFNIDGHDIVLFCPQGVAQQGDRFRNIYQSGYLMGTLNFDTLELTHDDFNELDHGFDFYAPQTMIGADDERILIGWMGLPDTTYPTDQDDWAHCLTIPRVLSVQNHRLIQQPIKALQQLRQSKLQATFDISDQSLMLQQFTGTHYELNIDVLENTSKGFHMDIRQSEEEYTRLTYESDTQRFTLDRTWSGQLPNQVDGTTRSVTLSDALYRLQIYVDTSSVEIFLNDGQAVMTSRIFPKVSSDGIRIHSEGGHVTLDITKYDLKEGQ